MPTISFSGLSSGIDTSGWVDALVSVRQQTITSLQEQQEAQEALLNVVNEIKSYFSSFQSCLSKITDSQFGIPSMDLFMQNLAVSSNTNIATATATTEAARQSYDVVVDSLATATKATSGYNQYEVKYATLDTQIGLLGAKNGTITVNQQSFSVTTEDTIRSLIQKFQNVGVSAEFNEQKGTFTVGVSLSEIDEGATNIKSALKLQDNTVSGAISGSLVYADRDTEFSKLGLTDGKVMIEGVEHTITQNGNNYTITKAGGTAADLNTVGDFLDYLMSSAVGAESADVDDMGNISIKGATLDAVTGGSNIIDVLNLSETFNRTAMESNRLTYIDVHVADLNTKLSDMGINATTTLTVGGNTHNITQDMTLGDIQNLLAAGNVDFEIDDTGVITIDTKGNEISGTLLDVLGLDPSKNGSTITSTVHESHYDADGNTLLSDLGVNNSHNYVAYDSEGKALTGNINNVSGKTINELIEDLKNAGLDASFDSTSHQIVINDGYIEGTLADALGMNKNTTSYTESATVNTTLEKLGATGNETLTIDGGTAKTYGKDTTLETVLNDIEAAGGDVTFKDGNVTIQGVTLGGTLPALLGLDATTQGTSVTSGALTVVTDSSSSGSDMDATIEHDITLSSKIGDILGTTSNYTLSVDGGAATTYTKDTTLQTLKTQIEAAGGTFTINDDNTISIENVTMSGTLVGALGFDSVENGTRFSTVNPVYIPGATTVANGSTSLADLGLGGASGISTFSTTGAARAMAAPAAAPRAGGGYTLSIDGAAEISYASGVTLDDIFADITAAGGTAYIDSDGYIVIDGVHLEGTLVDALGLVETSYGTTITSGNLQVTESMTSTSSSTLMGEKEGNLSWDSTVGSITGDDKSYLMGINGTTHTYATDVKLSDIRDDIVAAGGSMTLNSDNTISITGVEIDGTLATALGFDVTDYKTTISSNTPVYAKTEDVEATASTTFNDLGINTNLRDYAIYLPDGTIVKASSEAGSSGTATIGDWLNEINNALNTANGTSGQTYAKIENGVISITGGGYVTGSLPTALGMLTEEVITGTTMVGSPISYIEYEPLKYITSIQNGTGESGKDITYTGSIGNATNESGTAADGVTSDGLIGPEDEFVDLFGNITDATLNATLSELLTPGASDPLNNDARLPADSYTLKIGSYATKTFDSDTTTLQDVVDYIDNLKVYDPTYDMAFDAYLSGNKLVIKTDMDISGTLADVIGLTKVKTEDEYYTYVAKNVEYTALVEGASNGFNFSIVGDKVEFSQTEISKDGYEYTGEVGITYTTTSISLPTDDYDYESGRWDPSVLTSVRNINYNTTSFDSNYKIESAEDLKYLSDLFNGGLSPSAYRALVKANVTFRLTDDIDMSGINGFNSIGSSSTEFRASFEGQGYTISNLNTSLFGVVEGDSNTYHFTGINLQNSKGSLINKVTGNGVIIEGCSVTGSSGGSIVGTVDNISGPPYLDITGSYTNTGTAGNIIGRVNGGCEGNIYIRNCTTSGSKLIGTGDESKITGNTNQTGSIYINNTSTPYATASTTMQQLFGDTNSHTLTVQVEGGSSKNLTFSSTDTIQTVIDKLAAEGIDASLTADHKFKVFDEKRWTLYGDVATKLFGGSGNGVYTYTGNKVTYTETVIIPGAGGNYNYTGESISITETTTNSGFIKNPTYVNGANDGEIVSSGFIDAVTRQTAPSGAKYVSEVTSLVSGETYLIKSVDDLERLGSLSSGQSTADITFILENDIDMSGAGNYTYPIYNFQGEFYGNGHVIKNYTSNYGGLFDKIGAGGLVKDLGMENVSVSQSGSNQISVGGLADSLSDTGTIQNSYVTGSVGCSSSNTTLQNAVGGLVGVMGGTSTIISSYSTASVVATGANGGGLVGYMDGGEITKSYASGMVDLWTQLRSAGGFVGYVREGTITHSFSLGDVLLVGNSSPTGSSLGGFVGMVQGEEVNIYKVYSYGAVSGDSTKNSLGAFAGTINGEQITSSYYIGDNVANSTANSGLDIIGSQSNLGAGAFDVAANYWATEESFKDGSLTSRFAPSNGWKYTDNMVPHFGTLHYDAGPTSKIYISDVNEVDGFIEGEAYFIKSADDLVKLAELTSNYGCSTYGVTFILENDIDMSSVSDFLGIGNNAYFEGNFYGNGHVIKNLTTTNGGLFNLISGGTVQDLGLENVNVSDTGNGGWVAVGALAIAMEGGTIENVYVKGGTVTQTGENGIGGGLIGSVHGDNNNISYVYADVTVSSTGNGALIGGLIGSMQGDIHVSHSYASGDVTANGSNIAVGGLIGGTSNWNNNIITLEDVFASGDVTNNSSGTISSAAGLIGEADYVQITRAYASGNVSGSASNKHAFIGTAYTNVTITDSVYNSDLGYSAVYWDGSSGDTSSLKGLSVSAMKNQSTMDALGFNALNGWVYTSGQTPNLGNSSSTTTTTNDMTTSTTIGQLFGDTSSHTLTVKVEGGTAKNLTFSSTDTVQTVIDKLAAEGITASVTADHKFRVEADNRWTLSGEMAPKLFGGSGNQVYTCTGNKITYDETTTTPGTSDSNGFIETPDNVTGPSSGDLTVTVDPDGFIDAPDIHNPPSGGGDSGGGTTITKTEYYYQGSKVTYTETDSSYASSSTKLVDLFGSDVIGQVLTVQHYNGGGHDLGVQIGPPSTGSGSSGGGTTPVAPTHMGAESGSKTITIDANTTLADLNTAIGFASFTYNASNGKFTLRTESYTDGCKGTVSGTFVTYLNNKLGRSTPNISTDALGGTTTTQTWQTAIANSSSETFDATLSTTLGQLFGVPSGALLNPTYSLDVTDNGTTTTLSFSKTDTIQDVIDELKTLGVLASFTDGALRVSSYSSDFQITNGSGAITIGSNLAAKLFGGSIPTVQTKTTEFNLGDFTPGGSTITESTTLGELGITSGTLWKGLAVVGTTPDDAVTFTADDTLGDVIDYIEGGLLVGAGTVTLGLDGSISIKMNNQPLGGTLLEQLGITQEKDPTAPTTVTITNDDMTYGSTPLAKTDKLSKLGITGNVTVGSISLNQNSTVQSLINTLLGLNTGTGPTIPDMGLGGSGVGGSNTEIVGSDFKNVSYDAATGILSFEMSLSDTGNAYLPTGTIWQYLPRINQYIGTNTVEYQYSLKSEGKTLTEGVKISDVFGDTLSHDIKMGTKSQTFSASDTLADVMDWLEANGATKAQIFSGKFTYEGSSTISGDIGNWLKAGATTSGDDGLTTTKYTYSGKLEKVDTGSGSTSGAQYVSDVDSFVSGETYLIKSVDDLNKLASLVNNGADTTNVSFILENDIDMSSVSNFAGIGTYTNGFKGNFYGNGHVIKNLKINSSEEYVGFFTRTDGATIQDVGLENVNITSTATVTPSMVGALIAISSETTVKNSYVDGGTINSSAMYTGGLIGYIVDVSSITNSYSDVGININGSGSTGGFNAGGLIGASEGSLTNITITNSFSSSDITGNAKTAGGLIGSAGGDSLNITNAYADGNVSSSYSGANVGGLIGFVSSSVTGTITNAFYSGSTLSGTNAGGFIGTGATSSGGLNILNSAYNSAANANAVSGGSLSGVNSMTMEQLTNQTIMQNMGFTSANGWVYKNGAYPTFGNVNVSTSTSAPTKTYVSSLSGFVSGETYYIKDANDLNKLAELVNNGADTTNVSFILENDIDMSSVFNFAGIGSSSNEFRGNFYGNGHVIKNLTIINSSGSGVGFFNNVYDGAIIQDLGLENVNVTGDADVGGLVGYATESVVIKNSYVTGNVNGYSNVGGLAGHVDNIRIESSYADTGTFGSVVTGGLVGLIDNCFSNNNIITNSFAAGTVNGCHYAGGFAGVIQGGSIVSNSYTIAEVKGDDFVGGFVGQIDENSKVSTVYTYGQVSGNHKVGAFAGDSEASTVYTNALCIGIYTGGQIAGNGTANGVINLTFDQMKNQSTMEGYGFTAANGWVYTSGLTPHFGNMTGSAGSTTTVTHDATLSTTVGQLIDGYTSGTIIVNGGSNISVNSSTTIQDIINEFNNQGIIATWNNGKISLEASSAVSITENNGLINKLFGSSSVSLTGSGGGSDSYTMETSTGSGGSTTTEVTHDASLNTTVGQLVKGYTSGTITVSGGTNISVNSSTTIQDIIDKFNDQGIIASWNNGQISLESGTTVTISDSNGLISKLFGTSSVTLNPISSVSGSYTMDSVSSGSSSTNTYTMDAATTIGDLFGDSNNHTFTINGNNITLGPNDTVQDLIDALAGYGVTATITDGKMTIGSNSVSLPTVSGDLANKVLGKTGSGSVSVDYETVEKTLSLSTTMSELFWDDEEHTFTITKIPGPAGSPGGPSFIPHPYNITLSGDDTIQDLVEALKGYGIAATIDSSGKMTFKTASNWRFSGDLADIITGGVEMTKTTTPLYTFESEKLETYTGHQTVSQMLNSGQTLITGFRYHIASVDDLKALATFVNERGLDTTDIDFVLDGDLNLAGVSGLVPIGTQANAFKGNFYGNGHTISNLKISSTGNFVGLFGKVDGATIRDLGLENVDISGGSHVGALTGYAVDSTIENVYSTGKVTGTGDQIGGLIGDVNSSNVKNVYSTAEVEGNTNVGGLIGHLAHYSVLENVYATGDVHSSVQAGGLVGGIRYGGTIKNSYATGDVYGVQSLGGLVGLFEGVDGAYTYTLDTVYSTGRVEGTTNVGALIGWRKSNLVTVTNAVYNTDLEMAGVGNGSISRLTGLTYVDMQDAARMQGLGFTTAKGWKYISDKMTPVLNSVVVDNTGRTYSGEKLYVRGLTEFEAGDTYYIGTAEDLVRLAELVNAGEDTTGSVFILDGDINMAGIDFAPIGLMEKNAFRGDFYGNGHEISNLSIDRNISSSTAGAVGLFGYLEGAHIQDVGIVDANVRATGTQVAGTGILAGVADSETTITNSYTSGSVEGAKYRYTGTGDPTPTASGGFIGRSYADISKSYSTANVTGYVMVGGFVGGNAGHISQSYATGNVVAMIDSGNAAAGGFVGSSGQDSMITSSYATGRVNSEKEAGAFAGRLVYNAEITNSYATGFAEGEDVTGGFVGFISGSDVKITGAVYNQSTKLNAVGSGSSSGITGLELSQMWEQDRMEGLGFTADKGWLYADNTTPFLNTNNTMVNGDKTYVRDAQSFDSGEVFYIGTAQDLQHLAELVNNGAVTTGVTFVLDADITMSGTAFESIGTDAEKFNGVFMGNGHTISGLTTGLFGDVEDAIIRDVGLENVNINATANSTGALAGSAEGTTEIVNSYAKGTITSSKSNIGGLVGSLNSTSSIKSSYAEVNVTGSASVGGLVGLSAGTIENSSATGTVKASSSTAGGFVGRTTGGSITNSFAAGNVTASSAAGGFVGSASGTTITGSYAAGIVSGGSGFVGSVSGSNSFSGNVYNNANSAGAGGGTGVSIDDIKSQSKMEALGFTSDKGWVYYEGQTPQLRGKDTSKQYTVDASLDSILANLGSTTISKDITVEVNGTTQTKHFNDTDTVQDVMDWLNGISGVTAVFDEATSKLTISTDDGEMNVTGGLANTLFGGYANKVLDKITQNTDSSHLMAAGGDTVITESTTVKQLLNSNNSASIGFKDEDGTVVMESFDPDQTLGEVLDWLNAHGFNASITNGVFTAVKEDGSQTDLLGAIGSALKGVDGTTTSTPSGYVSDELTSTAGEKATGTTQLSALGIDSGNIHIQDASGKIVQTIQINNNMTVNDVATLLSAYGITMSINDGKVTVATDGPVKLVDGSSNMVSQMQLDNWIETKSKLTNTSTVAEMGFSQGASLGVIIDGRPTTISFRADDTLDDIITRLKTLGIEASVDADGKFTATSDKGFMLTDELGVYLTQNSVDGYVNFANGYKSENPVESPGNSTILTEDSLVGDILGTGEGGILRLTLDENNVVDLQYNADDTMQDIMVDLAAYGIETQIKNGVLTAVNLNRTFSFSGDIGKAISGNTPLYENIETGYISKDLSYETVETANMNSTMKELGILGGQIHILNSEGGMVTTLEVDESFTVSQIRSMLSPYGFNLTMDSNGKVSMTSSEGYSVSDGTSNLAAVMGLDNWNQTTEKLALDTTISEMGFKDGADLNLFLDGAVMNVLSFDADQTLQDVIFALSAYGIDASVDANGKFSAVSKEHTFIMSSSLGSFLTKGTSGYVNDDTGYQTVEALEEEKPYTVNSSEKLGYEKLMSADSTLASLGYENGGSVIVNLDGGTYYTLSFLGTDTVQDVIYALSPYGITAEVGADGKFNAVSTDHSFTLTGNVGNFLTSGGAYQNEVTGYETDPITFETTEKVTLDTKLSDLGVSHGDLNIMKDGKVTGSTINITDDTTVGQLFNAIKVYGMEGKIMTDTNGDTYIRISADSNTYLADGTANIVSGLGLVEIRQGDFEGNVIYWEDDTDSGLITEDMLLSTLDKNGYIAQGSLIFETGTGDEAVQHIINITADETVGSLIKKFKDSGIDASLSNGVIKISSGLDGITFTGGTSGLVNTIGLDIEDVDVYASSSSALTYEGNVHYSAANYATGDTLLSIVNATEGDMSVFVDGVKCTIHVDPNQTFADLFAQISSTVAARTGLNIKAGFLDKEGNIVVNPTDDKNTGIVAFEIEEGHELVIGASNDTTNFATIANLNKTDFNQITGSRSLYRVNVNSLLTESGLYRDGDITEGTFKIGDAEFTIDSTTTLASLIDQINRSQTAYATAYWDTLSGTMVIQSTLTGASLINIEAGTSNFTDIMGFTTVTDTGASALVTSSQTLGKNAVIRINGTTVTATSNVITSDVSRIKGLTINLKDVSEGETVTITVEQDDEAIFNAVSDTIDAYNAMMEALNKELSDKSTLGNEALLKLMRNNLKRLMTSSLSGAYVFKNLAAIGISTGEAQDSITLDVTSLMIDKDTFMNALDTDSDAVKALLVGTQTNPGIFLQANNIVESSIKSSGYFSNMIDSLTRNIDRIEEKINKTNDEINKYRDRLERQFHNMELTISGLQNAYSAFLN